MKKPHSISFGTDGWRAIISEEFTIENVEKVSQAIADVLNTEKTTSSPKIVIGYDTRFFSKEYAEKIAEVLLGNGFSIILASKFVPTPVISHSVVFFQAMGGIVVTASHNPFCFNGIKFKGSYGGPASEHFTKNIEKHIGCASVQKMSLDQGLQTKKLVIQDLDIPYSAFIKSYIHFDKISQLNAPLVIDSMYGAGQHYFESLLSSHFKGKISSIHNTINFSFGGINPEPVAHNLKELSKLCAQDSAIGLATDGDADRIGVFDETGTFVYSHQLIALFTLYLMESRGWTGGIAKSLSTTSLIDVIAKEKQIPLYETPIGFKHIATLMCEKDILIGGEESGGIGFKNHVPERDGLLAGILLLEMISFYKKPLCVILSQMNKKYGTFYYKREDIRYDEDLKLTIRNNFQNGKQLKKIDGETVVSINKTDGLKYTLQDDSWLLLRMSGTEPLLRIYAESSDSNKLERLIHYGKNFLLRTSKN